MATIRNIYFQDDINEDLKKEQNISKLINTLLKQYYKNKYFDDLNEEELKQELNILDLQDQLQSKIKEIRNGRQRPIKQ